MREAIAFHIEGLRDHSQMVPNPVVIPRTIELSA